MSTTLQHTQHTGLRADTGSVQGADWDGRDYSVQLRAETRITRMRTRKEDEGKKSRGGKAGMVTHITGDFRHVYMLFLPARNEKSRTTVTEEIAKGRERKKKEKKTCVSDSMSNSGCPHVSHRFSKGQNRQQQPSVWSVHRK